MESLWTKVLLFLGNVLGKKVFSGALDHGVCLSMKSQAMKEVVQLEQHLQEQETEIFGLKFQVAKVLKRGVILVVSIVGINAVASKFSKLTYGCGGCFEGS